MESVGKRSSKFEQSYGQKGKNCTKTCICIPWLLLLQRSDSHWKCLTQSVAEH